MDVLGHQDVPGHDELILSARGLEFGFEEAISSRACQQRETMVATEGDEVESAGVVEPNESAWHCGWILPRGQIGIV
jgi:hypothetical protein